MFHVQNVISLYSSIRELFLYSNLNVTFFNNSFTFISMDALDNGKCNVTDNAFNLPPLLYSAVTSAEDDSDVKIFKTISLGIEGSANKIGVGIIRCTCTRTRILTVRDQIESFEYEYKYFYEILCNPRKTYITPAGQGILVVFMCI